jgi:hypothetical protein
MQRTRCIAAVSALLSAAASAPVAAADPTRILAYEAVTFSAEAKYASVATLALSIGARRVQLVLEPNMAVLDSLDVATRGAVLGHDNLLLRGRIAGRDDSWARLSRIDGGWSGAIFDGSELILLDVVADVAPMLALVPADRATTIAYRFSDVIAPGLIDEVIEAPDAKRRSDGNAGAFDRFADHLGSALGKAAGATRELRMTIVTDTEFTTLHGGARDAVVAARINFADGVYSRQLGVQIVAPRIVHLTDNGTLTVTDGSGLLNAFRSYMTTGAGASIPKGGLNHLFSGKDLNGSTAGVAFVGVLCSTGSGYGVDQIRSNSGVASVILAHEAGHNFGAPHAGSGACASVAEGSFIMSPSVGGSLSSFSSCSVDQMRDDVTRAACVVDISGTLLNSSFE